MTDARRLMTRSEVAAYLAVDIKTFDRHAAKHIPSIRIGSIIRYDRADLDRWLDEQKVQPVGSTFRAMPARLPPVRVDLSPAAQKILDEFRQRRKKEEMGLPKGAAMPRDGDREQARNRVHYCVRKGQLPHPNKLPCADCGHVVSEGDKRRHGYDHPRGFGAAHHMDIEAVCSTCEQRRAMSRKRP